MSFAVSAHDVDDALARLHRQDPAAAAEAEQALHAFASADWDGGAAPPLEFDRLRFATWLWDTVPNTFVAPDEDKLHVVGAVARFLAELGPAGAPYTALCRHPATETLVTAAGDEDQIADLYRQASPPRGVSHPMSPDSLGAHSWATTRRRRSTWPGELCAMPSTRAGSCRARMRPATCGAR